MISLRRLTLDAAKHQVPREDVVGGTLCQSSAWLAFLASTQGGEPILAELRLDGRLAGYFSGMLIRRFGLRILGSPLPGWSTPYMGFALRPEVCRTEALRALIDFAFRDLRCLHVELMDRALTAEQIQSLGGDYDSLCGFEIDLQQPEETLFGNMHSSCRRCIRKAMKCGVEIEEVSPDDPRFALEYYRQLQDVFAKQGLVPTYDLRRVQELIAKVHPTGHLLLLRARNAEGNCIASGIFPALDRERAYFWGMASWRQHQILRPNELLLWTAMRYWKARGLRFFDMGGAGEYKRKYGGYEIAVPWFRISKYAFVSQLRAGAQLSIAAKQKMLGAWRNWTTPQAPEASAEAAG